MITILGTLTFQHSLSFVCTLYIVQVRCIIIETFGNNAHHMWLSNLNEVTRDARHCDHLPRKRRWCRHPPTFSAPDSNFWFPLAPTLNPWAWLGRAGGLLGVDILAAGHPPLRLHALELLRHNSPFDGASQARRSSLSLLGSAATFTFWQSEACLVFSAPSYHVNPEKDSFLRVGRI